MPELWRALMTALWSMLERRFSVGQYSVQIQSLSVPDQKLAVRSMPLYIEATCSP